MSVESRKRPSRTPLAGGRVTALILFSLLMSTFGLTASPQQPYIHELFGPELLISWREGQKLHENAWKDFLAGDFIAARQELDRAMEDAEWLSKSKEKDLAILLATKARVTVFFGGTREADSLLQ